MLHFLSCDKISQAFPPSYLDAGSTRILEAVKARNETIAIKVVGTNRGRACVRLVARGLYLANKKAYKCTACCNLASLWATKHTYMFINHKMNSQVAKFRPTC